jgi:hypothetical protein
MSNERLIGQQRVITLTNFGFDVGHGSIEQDLDTGTDEDLRDLAEHLGIRVPDSVTPPAAVSTTVRTAQPLFIFASHLSSEKRLVGHIRRELAIFGIELFVAHDSIADDAAWQAEIERHWTQLTPV